LLAIYPVSFIPCIIILTTYMHFHYSLFPPCKAFRTLAKHVIQATSLKPDSFLYHLGSTLGARDSCNHVRLLGAHLLVLAVHEAPLHKRAWVRSIFHSRPRAQVGTVDLEYHPQHRACSRWLRRSHGREVQGAAEYICKYSLNIGYIPRNESSNVIFLRRRLGRGLVTTTQCHICHKRGPHICYQRGPREDG
jgi:hypothetical protein